MPSPIDSMYVSTSMIGIVSVLRVPRAASEVATLAMVTSSGASRMLTKSHWPSTAYWESTLTPIASTSSLTSLRRAGLSRNFAEPSGPSVESIMNFIPERYSPARRRSSTLTR